MAEKRVSVRLAVVDGRVLKDELAAIGREGRAAFDTIETSARPASAAIDEVNARAGSAVVALENLSAKAAQTATSLRAAGAGAQAFAATPMQERINAMAGVTQATSQSTAAVIQHGRALDDLRAKYNPVFRVVRDYRQTLQEIRAAHAMGAISADEMAAAISRERQQALQSIAALKGRATALQGMAGAANMSSQRMAMLYYQLNDIGVSLASGQNPFTVMIQQGSQISQIYGFGRGGVNALMQDLAKFIMTPVRMFPVLSAAIAATGLAVAGMRREIEKSTGTAVTFGDVAKAAIEVIGNRIHEFLKPAIDAIAPWFQAAWDAVVAGVKWVGNIIINSFRAAFADIVFVWKALPAAIGAAVTGAANAVISGIEWMVNKAIGMLNDLAGEVNSMLASIPGLPEDWRLGTLKPISLERYENPFAGELGRLLDERNRAVEQIMSSDPLGKFFDDVAVEAVNNALERNEEKAKKAGSAGKKAGKDSKEGAEEAKTGWEKSAEALANYAKEAMDLAGAIGDAIVNAFQGAENAIVEFVKTGKFNFKELVTSIIADLARLAVRRFILGPIANALSGVFSGFAGGGFSLGGLFRSFDGGGHTGYGARAGGLDGKGGYLALVHPRERIVDETRSGWRDRGGRETPVIINISTPNVESFRQSRTQIAADIQRAVAMGRRGM